MISLSDKVYDKLEREENGEFEKMMEAREKDERVKMYFNTDKKTTRILSFLPRIVKKLV